MQLSASTCLTVVLSITLTACSTTAQSPAAPSERNVKNFDATGKNLSASSMRQIAMVGAAAMSPATAWCTLDPLPSPLPSSYKETVPSPYPLPNSPATSEFNTFWMNDNLPKRTWCLVKNEPEPDFYQCTTDSMRRCVDGDYFVINVANYSSYTWINFTNQHSEKVRLVRLIWEP